MARVRIEVHLPEIGRVVISQLEESTENTVLGELAMAKLLLDRTRQLTLEEMDKLNSSGTI